MLFKKILIPLDGSSLSNAAAHAGIDFAKDRQAEVIGIYVAPEYTYPIYADPMPTSHPDEKQYKASMRKIGDGYLKEIREQAQGEHLQYTGITAFSDSPAEKIVETAHRQDCDLIFMGSHGRGGWRQLLLGSVTNKVLSLCQIPVLVYRVKHDAAESQKTIHKE